MENWLKFFTSDFPWIFFIQFLEEMGQLLSILKVFEELPQTSATSANFRKTGVHLCIHFYIIPFYCSKIRLMIKHLKEKFKLTDCFRSNNRLTGWEVEAFFNWQGHVFCCDFFEALLVKAAMLVSVVSKVCIKIYILLASSNTKILVEFFGMVKILI